MGIDALSSFFTGGTYAAAKYGSKGEKVLKYADDAEDLLNVDLDDVFDIQKNLQGIQQKRTMNTNQKFKEVLYSRKSNAVIIAEEQIGKKIGKHTKEYGLNPGNESDRIKLLSIIDDIIDNAEEVVRGKWKCQNSPVLFYRKGEDLVLVREKDNNFVSIFKGGANNGWFKDMGR